ncbi:MAG: amidohydrolase family protein [Thermosediminibacteraceae bacterium]|nr:amidohydrolase family protein [Thermosediminibacteraceae bacterium]
MQQERVIMVISRTTPQNSLHRVIFVDSHVHISLNGKNPRDWRRLLAEGNYEPIVKILSLYKSKNIMMLRDGGDNFGASLAAREIAGRMGIIYKTPGWAIYKKGRYGSFLGKPVADIADFKSMFCELLKAKPDHLKVILTGIVDFRSYGQFGGISFSYEELYYMIQQAKEKELPVMVHANSSAAVKMAIEAGADTIEHGYFITDEELQMMAERDVIWVPTLSPLGNILENRDFRYRYQNQIQIIKKVFNEHLATVKKAIELGVKIAIGSDSGSFGVYHSRGFFDEVRHIKKCGISENQIFKMAFENGLKALNIKPSELKSIHQNNKEF